MSSVNLIPLYGSVHIHHPALSHLVLLQAHALIFYNL
uniref:Uncharacterized protein n=1 Tax=Anguilla anguilla TaxID=7936 RepID=A0A0E9UAP8_ANGAN